MSCSKTHSTSSNLLYSHTSSQQAYCETRLLNMIFTNISKHLLVTHFIYNLQLHVSHLFKWQLRMAAEYVSYCCLQFSVTFAEDPPELYLVAYDHSIHHQPFSRGPNPYGSAPKQWKADAEIFSARNHQSHLTMASDNFHRPKELMQGRSTIHLMK